MSIPLAARCHICNKVFLSTGASDVDYLTSTLLPQKINNLRNNAMAIKLNSEINGAVAFRTQIAYLDLAKPVHPACKAQLEAASASNASSPNSSSSSSWSRSLSPRAVTPLSPRPARLSHIIDINDLDDASSSSLSLRAVTPRPTRLSHNIDINDLDDASSSSLSPRVVTEEPSASSVHATSEDDLDAADNELDALDLIEAYEIEEGHNAARSGRRVRRAALESQDGGRAFIDLLSDSISITCIHRIATFAGSHLVLYGLFFSQIFRGLAYTALIPLSFSILGKMDIRYSEKSNHSEQAQRAFFIANMALDALFYARYFQWIALPLPAFLALNAASVVATAMFALHTRQR